MVKLPLIIFLSQLSFFSYAGSLDCTFMYNLKEYSIYETTQGVDEEESSETYEGMINNIKADILYLPFQEGIYLSLYHEGLDVEAASVAREAAEVSLKIKDNHYFLSCSTDI